MKGSEGYLLSLRADMGGDEVRRDFGVSFWRVGANTKGSE